MKKIFLVLISITTYSWLIAQEPADALRYSWYTQSGTARQQAVGGAMTSLGGDLSAAYINPAGLAFYKTGDIVITPGFNLLNNKATYFGRTEANKRNTGSFGATGVVFGTATGKQRSGVAMAIAINRTASFGSNLLYRGINNQSSYSQKFLEEIQNNNDKDANNVASNYPFGTSLAFNTYWIDTIAGGTANNYQFQTRAPVTSGLIQENAIVNKGGITELALAFAATSKEKYFFGLTLGVPFLHYSREATFAEADATTNINNFDFASITENLTTDGAGINLKLGFLYKPKEYIRLGIAVHTPTLYQLTDKYSASVTTNTETYMGQLVQNSSTLTNGEDAQFKYWLISPYRVMISASYVLREIQDVRKQKGFLTADIEYINYKASSFTTDPEGDNSSGTKSYLKSLNKTIDNTYKSAFNFKVGGELKFTTIMARLGAAYYGNPYKNSGHGEKGNRFQLSGGLGYRNKGVFVDLTYVHTMSKDIHFAYRLENSPYYGATIKSTGGNVLLTVGFKI
ncbi:MAG: aromatic hydrocarbon degradation protein [Chitinophagaceae bacterium]|nr:aromatic hydrocarbon degradation protein [Chitinophagaceae bacterium]